MTQVKNKKRRKKQKWDTKIAQIVYTIKARNIAKLASHGKKLIADEMKQRLSGYPRLTYTAVVVFKASHSLDHFRPGFSASCSCGCWVSNDVSIVGCS